MIKSPLRYPGGKSRAVKIIASLIPNFDEYREPFLGGGSVFIYEKQRFPQRNFLINDLYRELFLFWNKAQTDIVALTNQIIKWKKNFCVGKELYNFLNNNLNTFNELERAAAFFVYNRITFSGTSLSGGFSGSAFVDRFTESSIERLKELSTILDNTQITNSDYAEIVEKEGKNVFIFLDPPYYSATKSALYGKNGNLHKSFEHQRFADIMRNCKHKWLITYDDSPYIRDLFSFAEVVPWTLTYGMRNITKESDQNGKELFIANYPIRQLLPAFSSQSAPTLF